MGTGGELHRELDPRLPAGRDGSVPLLFVPLRGEDAVRGTDRKTGFSTGEEPTLPTVNTKVRDGGAPNHVNSPDAPSRRVSVSTDSRPAADSAGSGRTACPATWKIASASGWPR